MASAKSGDRRQQLFELTQASMDTFKERLREAVPLSSGTALFHEEAQILLAAEVAKSQVISEFKKKLPREDSIDARVESLEMVLDTILHEYLKENSAIRNTADKTMQTNVENLVGRFTGDLDEFHKANTLTENEKIESYHEKLKADLMDSWNELEKPGYRNLMNKFEVDFKKQLNEISSTRINKHQDTLEKTQAKIEAKIKKLVQQFEAELTAKIGNFGVTMTAEWNSFADELQKKTQEEFVREEKNPFPVDHFLHITLNRKLDKMLKDTRKSVEQSRFEELYRFAMRQCLINYLVSMEESIFGVEYLLHADLQKFHDGANKKALECWNTFRCDGLKASDFKCHVESKIIQAFALFQQQAEVLNATMNEQIKLLKKKCQDYYDTKMLEQIKIFHRLCATEALEIFHRECSTKSNSDFALRVKAELEGDLSDRLKEYLEIPKNAEDFTTIEASHQTRLKKDGKKREGVNNCMSASLEQFHEAEIFINLYRKAIAQHRENSGMQEIPEITYTKLDETLIQAFKKFCMLEGYDSDALQNELKARLAATRLADLHSLKNQEDIQKIIQKMVKEYNVKVKETFLKYPNGVETEVLNQHGKSVQREVMKLLEMEIKQKIRRDEPLEKHKKVLQSHIDKSWANIVEENNKNLQKKRKQDEMERRAPLSPLVFHLQSSRIVMAMAVGAKGNMKIIANEFGEPETPGTVAYSSKETLSYGTEAVTAITSCQQMPGNFFWSIADFFVSNDLTWRKTLSIKGKEIQIGHEFALGFLLGKLKLAAEAEMKGRYTTTVIAIPFWLSSPQRLKVKHAAMAAGFCEVYLVNEASAAAYNFVVRGKRDCRSDEVLVISENMDRVDVFVYSYSGQEKKIKMLANSSNYGVNHWNTRSASFNKSFERGLFQMYKFLLSQELAPSGERTATLDVCRACKYALELAGRELRLESTKLQPQECLCICENQRKWNAVLKKVSQDFGRNSCFLKVDTVVLNGAVHLSKTPKEIGRLIRDKMAYDVLRIGETGSANTQIISGKETLPMTIRKYTSVMQTKHETATFFQGVLESFHQIGKLKVEGVTDFENLEPGLEVSQEAIVSLGSVRLMSKLARSPCYVADERIQWSTPNILPSQLEAFSKQLFWILDTAVSREAATVILEAKADLIQRCQEMIEKINAGYYKLRSKLLKDAVIEKIMHAKEVVQHHNCNSLDAVLAQLDALEKIEQKYKK